jgi:hypothetical protein
MPRTIRNGLAMLLAFGIMLATVPMGANQSYAQGASQLFPETGKTVKGRFLVYWLANGGLPQQGYPISEEIQERSATDGKTYTMQYFERAVFEAHPENKVPNDVLLSLLGNFQYAQKYPDGAPNQVESSDNATYFDETGKSLGGKFREYWVGHGGLRQQGYPISDEFEETSALDGETYTVQYFERAVFEWHPENAAPYDVLLSQLGTFQYRERHGNDPVTPVEPATFSAEEVDYFVEVALGSEFHSSAALVAKWEQPVKVSIQGSPTEADRSTINDVVSEVNAIVGSQLMALVGSEAEANMHVIFAPPNEFASILPEYTAGNLGYFYFWFGAPQSINKATVLITTDGVTQKERSHLIREEVTQALGLAKDSNKYPDSIFYQPWTDVTSYAPIDRKLIKMLNMPVVKPGMNEAEVRAVFANMIVVSLLERDSRGWAWLPGMMSHLSYAA